MNKVAKWSALGCAGIIGVFGVLATIGYIVGPSPDRVPATARGKSADTARPAATRESAITAAELLAAYDDNEVAADLRYKGKRLRVSGTIDTIGKDILDTPYITIGSRNGVQQVQAMFRRRRDDDLLASLSKGQRVTVVCDNSGKTILNVILRNCTLE